MTLRRRGLYLHVCACDFRGGAADAGSARARRLRLVAVRVRGIVVVGGHWWSFLPAVMRGVGGRPAISMATRGACHVRRFAVKSADFVTAIRRIRGRIVGRFARFRVSAIGAHCLVSSYGAGLLFGGVSWVMCRGETEIIMAIV